MTFGNGTRTAGVMASVLLMLLGIFAIPVNAYAGPTNVTDKLATEEGTTTDLGGGDYFFVKFGTDAAFGIVWGTEQNENNVYFVAIKARYLGMAQVYDGDGNLVAGNHTVKIYTLYAVKLADMLEFDDLNDNGVLPYHRVYSNYNFTGEYVTYEPVYKKVDLKTAWEKSPVQYDETEETREWSFDLSAKDLAYTYLNSSTDTDIGDNKLNNFTLTFHLEAKMMQVDNATLPQWRITVERGPLGKAWWFTDADRLEDIQVSGKIFTYNVKWDQTIEGWDYDPSNANPTLLMEVESLVGNWIPSGVMTWMNMYTVRAMNEYGYMSYREDSGEVDVDDTTGTWMTPRTLSSPRLTFGGEKTRIGALEWVSNVTVDGSQGQVHAQIMAGVPVWAVARNGATFAGFAVLSAMTFPGGALIVHDPTFSSEAFVDVDGEEPNLVGLFALIGIGIAVVVVIAVLLVVTMGKKPGQKPQPVYERTMSSQPGEWAKYYNKK